MMKEDGGTEKRRTKERRRHDKREGRRTAMVREAGMRMNRSGEEGRRERMGKERKEE